jgi:tRNA (guanine37-N1)-methyltransferase
MSVKFHIITIFPHMLDSYISESLFSRAIKNKIIAVQMHDLRDFSDARYDKKIKKGKQPFARVEDRPFGGGPGMVLQIEPIYRAVETIKKTKARVILFSTRGAKFDAKAARRLAKYDELIFICGRYEGVDERVAQHIADEEISMGDYVLSGGEIPALTVMEAVSRFLPGFLGKEESLEEVNGSFPTYTRPEIFSPKKGKKWAVPKVLLSGDHKKIEEWRKK